MEIRFAHRMLGRLHVITSPDVEGLHVAADTRAEAERKAVSVAKIMVEMRDKTTQHLDSVNLVAA